MKDAETEQVLLQSLVQGQNLVLLDQLQPGLFGTRQGRILFQTVQDFHLRQTRLPSWADVTLTLREQNYEAEEYRLFLEYMNAAAQQILPEDLTQHVERLELLQRCRKVGNHTRTIFNHVDGEDLESARLELHLALEAATGTLADNSIVEDLASAESMGVVDEIETPLPERALIPTGWPEHDREIGGFFRQQLIIVAARRGKGKSALTLNMLKNFYLGGFNCTYLSLELTLKECKERLIAMTAETDYTRIQLRRLDDAERRKVRLAWLLFSLDPGSYQEFWTWVQALGTNFLTMSWTTLIADAFARFQHRRNKILIVDAVRWKIPKIQAFVQALAAGGQSEVVFVDSLNLAVTRESGSRSQHEDLTDGAYALKECARFNDQLLVATTQLGEDMRTKYAKGIEEAGDAVLYKQDNDRDNDRGIDRWGYSKGRSIKEFKFTLGVDLTRMVYYSRAAATLEDGIPFRLLRPEALSPATTGQPQQEVPYNLDEFIEESDYIVGTNATGLDENTTGTGEAG